MKRSLTLSLSAIALVACSVSSVRADETDIDLKYGGGTWSLYAEIINTVGSTDGSFWVSRPFVL